MNDQTIRFRLGIFVLATLILLAVLIILFGGFPTYLKNTDSYTIVFDNARGVGSGTPVQRSGVRIGEVRDVILDNLTGKVRVEIQIDSKYSLPRADRPTLVHSLLGGETAVAFLPPEEKEKQVQPGFVEPGETLEGHTRADASAVLQKTSDLVPPAQDALLEVKKVFEKIDKASPLLEEAIKDLRDVAKATRDVIPELRKTNAEIHDLAKSARQLMPELHKTTDELQLTLRTWGKVGERVDVFIQSHEDKVVKSLERLHDTLKRASDLLSDENQRFVKDILKNVRDGSNYFDSIAKNADELLKDGRVTLKRLDTTMTKAEQVITHLEKAAKPLAERSESILRNVDESTDKLNRTLGDLREIFTSLTRSDGTFQRLLTDPGLYNSLNETSAMVARLLPRVDRILRDMEIFADKLARHPEALGLGGLVRPGSGLKESPTAIPYRWLPGH